MRGARYSTQLVGANAASILPLSFLWQRAIHQVATASWCCPRHVGYGLPAPAADATSK